MCGIEVVGLLQGWEWGVPIASSLEVPRPRPAVPARALETAGYSAHQLRTLPCPSWEWLSDGETLASPSPLAPLAKPRLSTPWSSALCGHNLDLQEAPQPLSQACFRVPPHPRECIPTSCHQKPRRTIRSIPKPAGNNLEALSCSCASPFAWAPAKL